MGHKTEEWRDWARSARKQYTFKTSAHAKLAGSRGADVPGNAPARDAITDGTNYDRRCSVTHFGRRWGAASGASGSHNKGGLNHDASMLSEVWTPAPGAFLWQ